MPAVLPKTKPYRVAVLAVRYFNYQEGVGPDGQPMVVATTGVGRFGEHVDLTDAEAKRLEDLGPFDPRSGKRRPAVLPKDAPLTYDEMDDKQLKKLADDRGAMVTGSGANGEALKEDYINALVNMDRAATSLA